MPSDELHITCNVSPDLIEATRMALRTSIDIVGSYPAAVRQIGRNSYTPHAAAAYISAAAAVEAFLNETFLNWQCKAAFPASPLWVIPESKRASWPILKKIKKFPELLFGGAIDLEGEPFRDFDVLVKLRNDMVHFKMAYEPPAYIEGLERRGVLLVDEPGEPQPWPQKLACTEGIRWAHNAACRIVQVLVATIPEENRADLGFLAGHFRQIVPMQVDSWLKIGEAPLLQSNAYRKGPFMSRR